jgi:hypothetical protein
MMGIIRGFIALRDLAHEIDVQESVIQNLPEKLRPVPVPL